MISITKLEFDSQENPSKVSLVMDIRTAAWLAKHVGTLTELTTQPAGAHPACTELYYCLVGSMFNRFYDDGVNDYFRETDR